ncbi:hypothetical protein [Novosphingobium mathurense]|uniref:Uncharacterized protein n=1 Tax=Novosphingobium mathurense TaxID=428990 RepID=A0A1U6I6N7_9SPHN|nr:hypothetical protein [Novosphingobium mathurense]SLK03687.1 hypothetical protein SAMN06295987_104280 [Novosphingobium mathurense]
MTFILAILGRWGVPERFQRLVAYAGLALLCAALVAAWLWQHDRKVIAHHEEKITRQVEKKTGRASEAATEAAGNTKERVEHENERARNAASGGTDPLKSGLDCLRRAGADCPASR